MKELEKKMQNENFDVEVQYCDPDDCWHDCQTAPNYCNAHIMEIWQDGGMLYGKNGEKNSGRIQEELFDVEVQYCNPDDCYLDCQDAANHCNYHFTTMF